MEKHTQEKGYYFNYLKDAAMYYWAARGLELNYRSLDEKDKMLDALTVRRLRTLADRCLKQAYEGLKPEEVKSVSEGMELMKHLALVESEKK